MAQSDRQSGLYCTRRSYFAPISSRRILFQRQLVVEADGLAGLQLSRVTRVTLGPAEARWVTVALRLPPETAQQLKPGAQPIRWRVTATGGGSVTERSTFIVPR